MSIAVIPKYTTLFPNQAIPDLLELLKDTPSRLVIGVVSFLNSSFYLNESIENQDHFFNLLIERLPTNEYNDIRSNLNDFKSRYTGRKISIFNLYTNLNFIEWEILNYRNISFTSTTPQQELNILKGIMIFNEQLDDEIRIRGEETETEFPIYKMIWENYLPQLEFNGLNLVFRQFILGMDFLKYVEHTYPEHLTSYLNYLNAESINDFFKKVLEFLINGYNKETKNYRNHFPIEIINKNRILNSLILDIGTLNVGEFVKKGYDRLFKGLRRFPIIKHPQGFFDVVNWNFVTDKMTPKALIFDFYQNSTIKKDISFTDYKSDVGTKFSEQIGLRNIIRKSFDNGYKHLTSSDNDLITIDYYLRHENIVILIEFKDITVPDDIKNGKFTQIKEYFDTNLIKSKNGKPKGVTQLINQIRTINEKFNDIEDFKSINIEKNRLIIFPVLVTKDFTFSVPGLNDYLNSVFRPEVRTLKKDFFSIEAIVQIDFNSFIEWTEVFNEGKITFQTVLNNYHHRLCYLKENNNRFPTPNNLIRSLGSFSQTMSLPTTIQLNETSAFKEIVTRLELK